MQLKKYFQPVLNILIILLITFSLIEAIFFAFLKFPNLNKGFPYIKNYVISFYMNRDRDIMQFLPQCAIYDKELIYRLKEGSCAVKTREFFTKYDINKMGFRDDDKSLIKPEIIVLGDSHAMGWGVDQDKIFPSLIEKDSGMKVLNSAISSYGTAREFLMLKELDKSNLKYLVIQYCSNDNKENKQFVKDGYKLKKLTEKEYQEIVDQHNNRVIYNPFGYSASIAEDVRKVIRKKQGEAVADLTDNEIDNFLKIMNKIASVIDKDVKIILIEVNERNINRNNFAGKISEALNGEFSKLKNRMIILDSSKILTNQDYYILDDHMNENGHEKIAKEILQTIKVN